MNWGTAGAIGTGKTNGLSQFNSAFSVNFVNQNGTPVGDLTSISIGSTGLVTASFSNGQTQNLYQIPLATFSDPTICCPSSLRQRLRPDFRLRPGQPQAGWQ